MAWEKQVLGWQGRPPARTRVSFWGWKDEEPSSSLPSLKRRGCQEEARPGSWIMDVRLWSGPRARDVLGPEGWKDLVISFFSPRILADMSAALVLTEENWKRLPGYSLRVMPPAETSSTVPEISSTGSVKCRSFILMTDSRVCLTRFSIFSYSISSSVFPCACWPTFCRKVWYSRE